MFETVFTLQRTYKVPKERVRAMLTDVLSLPGVRLAGQGLCLQALDLYVAHNISFADAYTAAYMESLKLSEIYTWDTDFDRLPGMSRLEPPEGLPRRCQPPKGPL